MYIRLTIILILATGIYFLGFYPNEILISTLFTVASIFLSIGLTLIVTFDFDKIQNETAYKNIKDNIYKVRNSFLRHFILIIVAYIVGLYFIKFDNKIILVKKLMSYIISFTSYSIEIYQFVTSLMFSIILTSLCYFIINFIEIQKLKDDISTQSRRF